MAWLPISWTVPQYLDSNGDPYSGAVLKFYQDGTTTNTNMATDNTGGTQLADVVLDSNGYPSNGGSIFIPHIDQAYKLALYPTEAAADADTGAIWTIDNLTPADLDATDSDEKAKVSSNDSTAGYLNGKLVAGTGIGLTEGSDGGNETLTIATSGKLIASTDTSAGDSASVGYTAAEGIIITGQGSTSDVTLKNDADAAVATIPTGTTSLKLDGGQLVFPASQNASADANTLDDYEEGTWTPTLQDDSASDSESQTYLSQVGNYTKIGRMVFISGRLQVNSLGTLTTSEQARVAGLPFTAASSNAAGGISVNNATSLAITAGQVVTGFVPIGSAYIALELWDDTGGTTNFLISELSASGLVDFHGHYFV